MELTLDRISKQFQNHIAVDGFSYTLSNGVYGLLGANGAGKTTLMRMICTVLNPTSGEILFNGTRISDMGAKYCDILGYLPQNFGYYPDFSAHEFLLYMASLKGIQGRAAKHRVEELLQMVGLSDVSRQKIRSFSGGMKQRVIIAISLVLNPKILLADEPTTALDVTIQAQVLDTIQALRKKLDMSMILITHDLGIVAQTCEQVAIIYGGEVVEYADVFTIFENRMHPYTQGLFNSIPKLNEDVNRLVPIEGLMPDPTNLPTGCKFCTRCQYATDRCREEHPEMIDVGNGHLVRCFRAENTNAGGEQK